MTEEKESTKEESYKVVQIPTEHRLAIETPEGEVINDLDLLVKIANDLEVVKKSIVGK